MCRNIRTLFNFDPPATDEEIRAAAHALQARPGFPAGAPPFGSAFPPPAGGSSLARAYTIGRAPNGKVDYKRLKAYAIDALGIDA